MKILYTASVLSHICQFHLPVMEMLKERGDTVHVAANDNLSEKNGLKLRFTDEFYNFPFQRSPKDIRNLKAYKELKSLIEQQHYDVIVCNTPVVGVLTRFAARGVRKTGTKVVYMAHGFHFYQGAPIKFWLLYPIEKYMADTHTDILITVNKEDYKRAREKFRCPIKHINGVGVRTERYHPATIEVQKALRDKENLPDDSFVILCTKELRSNNNQKTILKSVAKIKNMIPNIILMLAGNGPDEQMLKELTKELGLEKVVRFLGYRSDLEQVVPAVDLVVSCSWRDGMPLNIIEAMLCGKPIIASHNRGHDELIEEGWTGYLVDKSDVNALADRIMKINRDQNMATQFGQHAYKKAQKYTTTIVVEQMRDIFDGLR